MIEVVPSLPATVARAIFTSGSSTVSRWRWPGFQSSGSSHGSTIRTPPGSTWAAIAATAARSFASVPA